MTAYQDIKAGRRLTWIGIVAGAAIALGMSVASITSDEGTVLTSMAFFALMVLPAALAYLALDRRPSLLTAAAMAALVQSVLLLTSGLGFLQLVPAILWYLAGQKRRRPAAAPRWATWGRPLLAAATVLPLLVLFVHLDPICTVTEADGTVVSSGVDTNAPSGWGFGFGTSGSSSTDSDGVTRSCLSNTIRPWESALSLVVFAAIVGLAVRWPTSNQLVDGSQRVRASGRLA
jgi:hypothetical protein